MIRLEIDNQPVALDPSFSLDIYHYNAIFDEMQNRGSFTYDIDIDLRQGENARLYQHMNRTNSVPSFPGRRAVLSAGGYIIVDGTEVVLECNGDKAKIQIVAGSSETNYIGSSTRVSELDLGELPEYTAEEALATLRAEPLSVPAVCTPVMREYMFAPFVTQNVERETIGRMVNVAEYTDLWDGGPKSFHGDTKFIGQPYLVIIIERVMQAMGWSLTFNIIRQMDYARRMIVIHAYETRELSKMIPNWTVGEFIEQVQRMFNVIFVYNQQKRTVGIHSRESYYRDSAQMVRIDEERVIRDEESPARKLDSNEQYVYGYESVRYDFPPRTYGYRGDISDEVHDAVAVREYDKISSFSMATSSLRDSAFYNTAVLIRDKETDTMYMVADRGVGGFSRHIARIDQFAHARKDTYIEGESTETVLRIVPAETLVMSIYMTSPTMTCGVVIPYAQVGGIVDADLTTNASFGLNQWVEGNFPKRKDTSSEKLYVAQFIGMSVPLNSSNDASGSLERYATARYPQVFTHRYIDGRLYGPYMDSWSGNWRDYIMDALWQTPELEDEIRFDLKYRIKTTYASDFFVNDKEEHTITFKASDTPDVSAIFIIGGRRFVCVSVQRRIEQGRLMPYAIGTFLPVR